MEQSVSFQSHISNNNINNRKQYLITNRMILSHFQQCHKYIIYLRRHDYITIHITIKITNIVRLQIFDHRLKHSYIELVYSIPSIPYHTYILIFTTIIKIHSSNQIQDLFIILKDHKFDWIVFLQIFHSS